MNNINQEKTSSSMSQILASLQEIQAEHADNKRMSIDISVIGANDIRAALYTLKTDEKDYRNIEFTSIETTVFSSQDTSKDQLIKMTRFKAIVESFSKLNL